MSDPVGYDQSSPLERLALACGWRSGTVILVTGGFFDESGEQGANRKLRRLTLGGFYTPLSNVKSLCDAWREALAIDSLEAFHIKKIMSDEHSYSSWSTDRQSMLNRYVDILCKHATCFGAYSYLVPNGRGAFQAGYEPALHHAMMIGNTLCRDSGQRGQVVFAQTDEVKSELIGRYFDRLGYGDYMDGWAVQKSAANPALQAAEIVARGMKRLMQDGGITWSFWRVLTVGAESRVSPAFWPHDPLQSIAEYGLSPHFLFETRQPS